MNKKILELLLVVGIVLVGVMLFNKVEFNKNSKATNEFIDKIISKAEVYAIEHIDEYPEFKNPNDSISFTVSKLIDEGYLNEDINNPLKKEFNDIIVKLTIESDLTINYQVIY